MALIESLYSHLGPVGQFLQRRRSKRLNAPKPETFGQHIWAWIKTLVWAVSVVTIINGLALASFTVPTGSMESTVMAGDFLFVNKFIFGPSTPQIIPFINMPLPYYKLPPIMAPEQGDVIVFVFPGNRDETKSQRFEYYLKRCVAVAGDTLQIRNSHVFVNNVEFALPEHGQFLNLTPEMRTLMHESDRAQTFPMGMEFSRDDYGPIRIPKEGDVIELNESTFDRWAVFIAREGHDVNASRRTVDGQPITSYTVKRDYVFGMGDNRDNSLDSRFWGFIPEESVVGTPMVVYWSWQPDDPQTGKSLSLFKRLGTIRWGRLGTIIR
ncbi:MAG: signal peptidase I [Candidatus Kapabacteria bacterium]|nr:signal peptidase I [Candidatus Kapabacteria bacterium]